MLFLNKSIYTSKKDQRGTQHVSLVNPWEMELNEMVIFLIVLFFSPTTPSHAFSKRIASTVRIQGQRKRKCAMWNDRRNTWEKMMSCFTKCYLHDFHKGIALQRHFLIKGERLRL